MLAQLTSKAAPPAAAAQRQDCCLPAVLMYLGEVEEGGETNLPLAEPIDEQRQRIAGQSECAAKGALAVRPKKGGARPRLMHGDSCPPVLLCQRSGGRTPAPAALGARQQQCADRAAA